MSRRISTSTGELTLSLTDPLASGGSDTPLTITKTGTITATGAGVDAIYGPASTTWTIYNRGTVSSAGGWGVSLAGAGAVDNSGAIYGWYGGVQIGDSGTVTNQGTIRGGVEIGGSGVVTNRSGGSITGRYYGVQIGDSGMVTNRGTIGDGIKIGGSGVVTNGIGGSISVGPIFGVVIGGSGLVTNRGTIEGGIMIRGLGTVTNQATIRGASHRDAVAIEMTGGGVVTNSDAGSILSSSPGVGVEISGGVGKVTNGGTISAGLGVSLADGGAVTNSADGSISGGVEITGGSGTVANQGAIAGGGGFDSGNGFGVEITGGGVVSNEGRITAADTPFDSFTDAFGVGITGGAGTVTNHGSISGNGYGVDIADGGVVTNSKGASISGSVFGEGIAIGVAVTGGSGTVTNAGTITGSTQSVLFGSGTTNDLLVIDPGAVFNGAADATGATNSTIELTKGTGAIGGIGLGQFLGFDKLEANRGANWTLSGPNTIGTVLDDGTLGVSGSLTVSTAVDSHSTGLFQLDGASSLEVAAALGSSWKMSFATGSELTIDNSALFGQNVGTSHYAGPLLEGFGGATIDIKDFSIAGIASHFSTATGLLQLTNSASQMATLDFQTSSLGSGAFHFHSDGSGGVLITHS